MTEREEEILDAAITVFLRYGVQRSSMSDIAKEANVARQTLYNAFAGKNEVLRATIRLFYERSHKLIAAELPDAHTLEAKLKVFFAHTVYAPYIRLHESPNAADFIQGCNQVAKEEIQAQDERLRMIIESILRPYRKALSAKGTSAKQVSDFVQRSSSAIKHEANNKRHLHTLMNTLITMVSNTIGADATETISA